GDLASFWAIEDSRTALTQGAVWSFLACSRRSPTTRQKPTSSGTSRNRSSRGVAARAGPASGGNRPRAKDKRQRALIRPLSLVRGPLAGTPQTRRPTERAGNMGAASL